MRRRTVLAGSGRGSETQVGSRVGTVLATSCFRDVALLESLNCTKRKLGKCLFLIIFQFLTLSVGFRSERRFCGSKQSKKEGIRLFPGAGNSSEAELALRISSCLSEESTATSISTPPARRYGWVSFACIFVLVLIGKRKGWSRGRPAGDALPSRPVGFCARC